MKSKIIIITGPTGSGKTELAVRLAKKFNGEIIGADSRQIYRGMKIGTAAPPTCGRRRISNFQLPISKQIPNSKFQIPKPCLYKGVPHYLIGFLEPDKIFSVAEFKEMAQQIANNIISRNKVPIICGGTAFYLHALTENLEIPRVPPNWKFRKELENKNLKILIKQLKKLDNAALKIVDLKNKRRVVRAIEVCLAGYKFSEFGKKGKPLFDALQIGVNIPREELYKRIDARVEEMIKGGLIQETKELVKYFRLIPNTQFPIPNKNLNVKCQKFKNLSIKNFVPLGSRGIPTGSERIGNWKLEIGNLGGLPALSGIGYKEIIDYLAGKISLKEASQLIKYRTHKYVRGQMGWFRKNKNIQWVKNYKEAEKIIKVFL